MTSATMTRYLVLLGAPGAGKGTQAQALTAILGLPHVASGDVFRAVRQESSELGDLVRSYYDQGLLIPDEVAIQIMLSVLGRDSYNAGAMLDGFPRTIEQARALDADLTANGRTVWKAIYIQVDPEELIRRISGRWLCRGCSAVYHERNHPPRVAGVCDVCGCQLYQRVDDTEKTARRRLAAFFKETEPLVAYYRRQGKLCEVDGEQNVDVVTHAIVACTTEACVGEG